MKPINAARRTTAATMPITRGSSMAVGFLYPRSIWAATKNERKPCRQRTEDREQRTENREQWTVDSGQWTGDRKRLNSRDLPFLSSDLRSLSSVFCPLISV